MTLKPLFKKKKPPPLSKNAPPKSVARKVIECDIFFTETLIATKQPKVIKEINHKNAHRTGRGERCPPANRPTRHAVKT
jgi:hypothetical protein